MADFTLDTSGLVTIPLGTPQTGDHRAFWAWPDLSPFEQGYLGTALRGVLVKREINPRGSVVHERDAGFSDLHPETLAAIRKDCAAMAALILGLDERDGRDIWQARQKGFPGSGTVIEYMRASFPPLTPFLDDAGRVCLRLTEAAGQ